MWRHTSQAVTFITFGQGRSVPIPTAGQLSAITAWHKAIWSFCSVNICCHSYALLDSSWQHLRRHEWIWVPVSPLRRYCAFFRAKSHPLAFQICVRDWSGVHRTHLNGMGCYYCPWLGYSGQWSLVIYVLTNRGQVNMSWFAYPYISFNHAPSPMVWMHNSIRFCS